MKSRLAITIVLFLLFCSEAFASRILIPMDSLGQANHLKAYGIAFAALQSGTKVEWLLNYKGGSFVMEGDGDIEHLCKTRGVTYSKLTDRQYADIVTEIDAPSFNGAIVLLDKVPKIAVYTPPNKEPWDDAVTLALTYAEIRFDKLYAGEVLAGALDKYDWLHLHHEDFTGQYGKFWAQFQNADWYRNDKAAMEAIAARNGFKKVSQLQLAVVKKIRDFVGAGGNLFAMCSATETFDIALAANGVDICDSVFDGDGADPDAQRKLDFSKCFAFKDFKVVTLPWQYVKSDIDNTGIRRTTEEADYFKLVPSQAKFDKVSAMLCQDHATRIKGFMGQTTAFRGSVIKPDVTILADHIWAGSNFVLGHDSLKADYYLQDYEARYIHGEYKKGTWTFYGGHDPEDYRHHVGDPVTDLSKYPHSPGYRLILNNVLFPAAPKTTVPTVVMNRTADTSSSVSAVPNETNTIKIQPNPVNEELVISSKGAIRKVEVMNMSGKLFLTNTFGADRVTISTKDLTPGMYLIRVNGEYVGKVVKE